MCRALVELDTPGYAIGGLSVGEPGAESRNDQRGGPAFAEGEAQIRDGSRNAGRATGVRFTESI